MKQRAWLAVLGMGLASVGNSAETAAPATPPASTLPTTKTAPTTTTTKSAVSNTTATKPTAKEAPKAATPAPKKEEPMGKIEGTEIKRGAGYMGIALVGGTFKLSFYDSKKKPMAVPAEISRAALRWPVSYRQGADERTVLNRSEDGKSLSSPKAVKPPHNFRLFIVLLASETAEEGGGESYSIDFRG